MVNQALVKDYEEIKHERVRDICTKLSLWAQKHYEKFGENPVICWVNDDGYADLLLRRAVARNTQCGIVVMCSTKQALEATVACNIVLYVSNMGRPGDFEAGITLLKKLREQGNEAPYLVYTSQLNKKMYGQKVIEAGGQACVSFEESLLAAVYAAMKHAYGEIEDLS